MNTNEEKIRSNILQIRRNKKFTQLDMGEKLNITESAYNRIESGKTALSYKHLSHIASVFNIDVIDIITYPDVYELRAGSSSTKVLVELDVSNDEFIKMGLKDKVIQILNK